MDWSGISRSSALGRMLRAPLTLIPDNAVLPVMQGPLRGRRWVVGSATHGCWLGSYEMGTQRQLTRLIRAGMTVFDVGANVGFFTLLASKLAGPNGRVCAFEPLPRNVAYLDEHLRLNHVQNVTVVQAAVTDRSGVASFSDGANASMGRLNASGVAQVSALTLDECSIRYGDPSVLKMDIEGEEARALRGAGDLLRRARPAIYLATHGTAIHEECCRLLRDLGYALTVAGPFSPGHRDVLAEHPGR